MDKNKSNKKKNSKKINDELNDGTKIDKIKKSKNKKEKVKKPKKKHKIFKRIVLTIFLLGLIAVLVGVGMVAGIFFSDKYKVTREELEVKNFNKLIFCGLKANSSGRDHSIACSGAASTTESVRDGSATSCIFSPWGVRPKGVPGELKIKNCVFVLSLGSDGRI